MIKIEVIRDRGQQLKEYRFTEKELLELIQMTFNLGRGAAPDDGPLTIDWPLRILRHVNHYTDEAGKVGSWYLDNPMDEK